MIILDPIPHERIWGTKKLDKFSLDHFQNPVGSLYSASGISTISSPLHGENIGASDLQQAIIEDPHTFGLPEGTIEYPLIISITGADKDLSIQVHPTDEYAQKYEDRQTGKSESWFFIDGPKEGYIYAESRLQDKVLVKHNFKEKNIDKIVNKKKVSAGDIVFIPSGTLHALTKGSLVYEIQQSTDITYRFYDYDRVDYDGNKRELHFDKALGTLGTSNKISKSRFEENEVQIQEPYKIRRLSKETFYSNNSGIAEILTSLDQETIVNGYNLEFGHSVMLLPGEDVSVGTQLSIIATPKI